MFCQRVFRPSRSVRRGHRTCRARDVRTMSRDKSPVFVSPRISVTVTKFRHSVFLPSIVIGSSSAAGFVTGLAGPGGALAGVGVGTLVAVGATGAAVGVLAGVELTAGGIDLEGGGAGGSSTGCCSTTFATSSAVNAGMTDFWSELLLGSTASAFCDLVSAATAAVNLLAVSTGCWREFATVWSSSPVRQPNET